MMKEYLLRVLIASAAVIAVITYALFLNTRLSVGRYEVKNIEAFSGPAIFRVDRMTGKTWIWWNFTSNKRWMEFPIEPSKQVSNPPEKQTGSLFGEDSIASGTHLVPKTDVQEGNERVN